MKLQPGKLYGHYPRLDIIGPDLQLFIPKPAPLRFIRPNGQEIILDREFETDIGSIPTIARIHPRLSKGYYNIAYLFHDDQYAKRERGELHLNFREANRLLGEVILTLQTDGFHGRAYKGGRLIAHTIVFATGSPWGKKAWDAAENRLLAA